MTQKLEGETEQAPRAVRSFVRRAGRLTVSQRKALAQHWSTYGLDSALPLDFESAFGRDARCVLEIGFGMGDALLEMAVRHPEYNFVGVEVHEPGIGRVLRDLVEADLHNVRLARMDAVEFLENSVRDGSLGAVLIFFPDPWPKKRHHKRRLIQPPFVDSLAAKLVQSGQLHLATDWGEYAEQMLEVIEANHKFRNLAGQGNYSPRPDNRPVTKFETRGTRLGHGVWDLLFERC